MEQTRIHNNIKGVFIQRVVPKDGKPDILTPLGYTYNGIAILRKTDETDADLQKRCLDTVSPWTPQHKDGLDRPIAIFRAINETADVQ